MGAAALSVDGRRCLSVGLSAYPSVCLSRAVPDHKSRMMGLSKLNIGKKEAHETGDS